MSTTDRMPDLNSQREITDRLGQTVVLGNSVAAAAIDSDATIVAACAGAVEAKVPFDISAISTLAAYNGSFGLWSVFLDIDAIALLQLNGAAIAAGRVSELATGLLTWGADAMLLNIQIFTATGTYTPTTGTAQVVVHCLGGGGGGGGAAATTANNSCASGGGAGAYAIGRITSGFSGVTVTIGAGGAGGAAGANNGTAGGATSFGSLLIGGGGGAGVGDTAGGIPRNTFGGGGGSASGSASLFGAIGEKGGHGHAPATSGSYGGGGGASVYGEGGSPFLTGGSAAGDSAIGFGAGGGGGANAGTNSAVAGGNGSPGLCIIYEYNA